MHSILSSRIQFADAACICRESGIPPGTSTIGFTNFLGGDVLFKSPGYIHELPMGGVVVFLIIGFVFVLLRETS